MYVNPNVFKAYDIRGIFPEEINSGAAHSITRAFAEFLCNKEKKPKKMRVVVANDGRPSSPELKKSVIDALLEDGFSVVDMGFSTTPFHYFTVIKMGADGGIMVTASHDPQRMNGLKLTTKGAESPIGEDMDAIKILARRGVFRKKSEERGVVEESSLQRDYIDYLLSKVDLSQVSGMKVVFDAGGGMSGVMLPYLLKRLPCETVLIGGEMTYASAFQMLNPSIEEHLANLKNEVLKRRASFGVAFDQDGDRTGFVTQNSRFFRPDYVAAFFAREFLKKNNGLAMVYDIRSSSVFRETIAQYGGRELESRVGHSFIKALMRKEDAYFAAELSGHFYFKEFYYLDSDFLPVLYFLEFLSRSGKSSGSILEEFEIYPSSGELSFKAEQKENILEKIADKFADAKELKKVDGLSLYYDDWWANIRISNTEPLVRLNVEARTREVLEEKIETLTGLIK